MVPWYFAMQFLIFFQKLIFELTAIFSCVFWKIFFCTKQRFLSLFFFFYKFYPFKKKKLDFLENSYRLLKQLGSFVFLTCNFLKSFFKNKFPN